MLKNLFECNQTELGTKPTFNRAGSSTHRKRSVTLISKDNVREIGYN